MQRFIQECKQTLVLLLREARRVYLSSLVREGIGITLLTIFSKAVNFVASAFAAQCVGASNYGISGVITAWAAQASLLFNGGLDTVVAREAAQHQTRSTELVSAVISFRLFAAIFVSTLWVVITWKLIAAEHWAVWQLGIVLVLCNALNFVYLFQAFGKLLVLNLITSISSLLTAMAYAMFSPPMPLGADLLVVAGANAALTVVVWRVAIKLTPSLSALRLNLSLILQLLRASWKYWVVAVAQFFYTSFQLLILSAVVPEQAVGVFRSALLIANALDVIFGGFYNLLLPRFVAWKNVGESMFESQRRKTLLLFILIGIFPTGVLALFGSMIYDVFFGAEFSSGAVPLACLAVSKFLNFIGQIYAYTLIVDKRDTDIMKGCAIGSLASVALSISSVHFYGINAAAVATLFGEGVITYLYIRFSIQPHNRLSNRAK